jgi:hypothetical protein
LLLEIETLEPVACDSGNIKGDLVPVRDRYDKIILSRGAAGRECCGRPQQRSPSGRKAGRKISALNERMLIFYTQQFLKCSEN